MMVMALTVAPVFALLEILVEGPLLGWGSGYLLPIGAGIGIVVGAAFGLAYGLIAGDGRKPLEPSRIRIGVRDPKSLPWPVAAHRFRIGFAACLVVGVGYGLLRAALYVFTFGLDPVQGLLAGLIDALVFGPVFGLVAGFTLGLMALCEAPLDTKSVSSPEELLRANRTTTIVQVLVFGPLFAVGLPFTGWLVVSLLQRLSPLIGLGFQWDPLSALVIGLIGGVGGGTAYAISLTAWGQWLVFGRIWLPLTRRLPWALPAFLEDAYAHGVLRRAGVVYRFRHERLQDHLADAYRSDHRSNR